MVFWNFGFSQIILCCTNTYIMTTWTFRKIRKNADLFDQIYLWKFTYGTQYCGNVCWILINYLYRIETVSLPEGCDSVYNNAVLYIIYVCIHSTGKENSFNGFFFFFFVGRKTNMYFTRFNPRAAEYAICGRFWRELYKNKTS